MTAMPHTIANTVQHCPSEPFGWQAELRLGFTRKPARTLLSRRQHRGPLQVQRAFYPETDGCSHVYILHPPGGEAFSSGGCDLRLSLWRDGTPLLLERQRLISGKDALTAVWGLRGQPVMGTLLCSPVPAVIEPPLMNELTSADEPDLSITTLDGVLVCRYLGPSANRARQLFTRVWQRLRPALLGKPACTPRVWAT